MAFGIFSDAEWALQRYIGSGGSNPIETGRDLDRFFSLTLETTLPLAMINQRVDLLWHTFIEHTELYFDFCLKRFGHVIHHRPRSSALPIAASAVRNFYAVYQQVYGEVGPEWERDAAPEVVRFGRGQIESLSPNLRWSGWPGLVLES
ncbi:hypothetical protein [Sphingomonas sp.]|jgi:hypothetical protein|uniref:hypothetical protein n=1 Tax=Sphingomonas sp. TaxID=28214 RepID=UPI002ED9E890